ncbi:DUF6053 domain-containing protein [Lysobacter enzymogenes]|uniref:DUF6053 domain-containing protein n=1 Tax=Lysobacter enzymogenes TaxID=69 RepID=UPI003D18B887
MDRGRASAPMLSDQIAKNRSHCVGPEGPPTTAGSRRRRFSPDAFRPDRVGPKPQAPRRKRSPTTPPSS